MIRMAPFSMEASSRKGRVTRSSLESTLNRIWLFVSVTITTSLPEHHLHQLTAFLNSLHNDTLSKAHLEVHLLSNEEYCKVEFRNENETLLSTLKWKLSSPCIDCQVSPLSDSLCPMRKNKYSIVIPLPRLGAQAPPLHTLVN